MFSLRPELGPELGPNYRDSVPLNLARELWTVPVSLTFISIAFPNRFFQAPDDNHEVQERKGVMHIVQFWRPTGQGDDKLSASRGYYPDTIIKTESVQDFIRKTSLLHSILSSTLERIDKEAYDKYREVYKVCEQPVAAMDEAGNAIWLGRAVLFKMQVDMHKDLADGKVSWCGCINGGSYERYPDPRVPEKFDGAVAMVFPQLKLAFA